ncbi:MAG: hypothetical protein Q4A83_08965 [Bacillota bacterium]|nr:hypothetical protein [Bacillota bacterium]
MKVCNNCRNGIPDGMKICPHCSKLPPQLFPNFYLYLVLTIVALGASVYFRPFANVSMLEQVSVGMLWVAFVIFAIFGLLFAFVSVAVFRDCKHIPASEKLGRSEITRYKNMCRHISAGRHYYAQDDFCTVCGHRRNKKK